MSVRSKPKLFEFDYQYLNEHVQVLSMLENDVRVRSMFDKMVFDPSLVFTKHMHNLVTSDGLNTILSNTKRTQTSFFENRTNSNMSHRFHH